MVFGERTTSGKQGLDKLHITTVICTLCFDSRAPSSHSLASSGSHFSSHQGARPAPSYKVISKPMYVEQVSRHQKVEQL